MKKNATKLLIFATAGILLAGLVAWGQGLFVSETKFDVMRILSDSFFVSGALLLGIAGLKWCVNGGVVDGLGYGMKTALSVRWSRFGDFREKFSDYRERKHAKDTSPLPMALAGLVHLAIAVIFFLVYSNLEV